MKELKEQFQKAIDHLAGELNSLRTGQATPALVENISVEAYGALQPLKTVASISAPDSKTIQIEPWDASVVQGIERAIQESDIGINPIVDGKTIRLTMPMMTDETRQKMIRVLKEKMEDAKVAIRKIREDAKKKIESQEGVGKDQIHGELEDMEKEVKDWVAKVDDMGKKKEEEMRTI